MGKPEVKVGQVWREKDKRFVRYVKVVQFLTAPMREDRVKCAPCREDGKQILCGRITKIKVENLQTRFDLIS